MKLLTFKNSTPFLEFIDYPDRFLYSDKIVRYKLQLHNIIIHLLASW